MHLTKGVHDVTLDPIEIWCTSRNWNESLTTEDVEAASCEACLVAAFEYGICAMRRRLFLKDGRILDKHQAIEKLLDEMAHPLMVISVAKEEP